MNRKLFTYSLDSLYAMRNIYLKDIEFIKTTTYNGDDKEFINKYLLHLEIQVEEINEELIARGVYE